MIEDVFVMTSQSEIVAFFSDRLVCFSTSRSSQIESITSDDDLEAEKQTKGDKASPQAYFCPRPTKAASACDFENSLDWPKEMLSHAHGPFRAQQLWIGSSLFRGHALLPLLAIHTPPTQT